MLKRDKNCLLKKIYILNIVKLDRITFKILYFSNLYFENKNYKGYFLESCITYNSSLYQLFKEEDFNKWYYVGVNFHGDILCLYYAKRKIDFQAYPCRQFLTC